MAGRSDPRGPGVGSCLLKITPHLFQHIAPRGGGRVRVAVHVCDPASGSLTQRRIRVHVNRKQRPPLAIPIEVRARRVGKEIRVRWRTAQRAFRVGYTLEGRRRRSVSSAFGFEAYGFDTVDGRGPHLQRAPAATLPAPYQVRGPDRPPAGPAEASAQGGRASRAVANTIFAPSPQTRGEERLAGMWQGFGLDFQDFIAADNRVCVIDEYVDPAPELLER